MLQCLGAREYLRFVVLLSFSMLAPGDSWAHVKEVTECPEIVKIKIVVVEKRWLPGDESKGAFTTGV